jgi:hypothetical protein
MTSNSSLRVEWLEVSKKLQPQTEKFWITLDARSTNITLVDLEKPQDFERFFAEWVAVRFGIYACAFSSIHWQLPFQIQSE